MTQQTFVKKCDTRLGLLPKPTEAPKKASATRTEPPKQQRAAVVMILKRLKQFDMSTKADISTSRRSQWLLLTQWHFADQAAVGEMSEAPKNLG